MSKYRIEKGKRLPETLPPTNRKYPFNEMEIGESFCVELSEAKRIRSAAHMYGKRTGTRFATRMLTKKDGEITGVRVMRVE